MSSPRPDLVVAVDSRGEPVGAAEKLAAHEPPGVLHLAFSVFVFDPEGRLLLQQRAGTKYHFAGRWSNSCCGHPRPGEGPEAAVERRIYEELGMRISKLRIVLPDFRYSATDASGMVENEICPVYVAHSSDAVRPDSEEVAEYRWTSGDAIILAARHAPFLLSPWSVLQITALGRLEP